jgi:hypothetical protein
VNRFQLCFDELSNSFLLHWNSHRRIMPVVEFLCIVESLVFELLCDEFIAVAMSFLPALFES